MQFLFLGLFAIAFVLLIVGQIMFVIAAFRVSIVWGLCVVFLAPASLIFLIMYWEDAKRAFGIQMLGTVVAIVAIFSGFGSVASGLGGVAEQLAESGISEEQIRALQEMAEGGLQTVAAAGQDVEESVSGMSGEDPLSLIGSTVAQAKEILGRPKGQMKSGEEVCLLYDTFTVFSADGETITHVEVGDGAEAKPSKNTWGRQGRKAPAAPQASAVKQIANGGKRVDLKQVIVPGKITVVDFYADWCGPCRRIGPQLEQMARSDPDVVLCKIDIVDWNTPVVQQFNIRSVPNIRVYDRNGTAVGSPTAGLNDVKQNIERAR